MGEINFEEYCRNMRPAPRPFEVFQAGQLVLKCETVSYARAVAYGLVSGRNSAGNMRAETYKETVAEIHKNGKLIEVIWGAF